MSDSPTRKKVLISGASFAGLSMAFWMNRFGYDVTVVEIAGSLKKGGTPVDIKDQTIEIARRMGILAEIQANSLSMEGMEFKNAQDETVAGMLHEPASVAERTEYEIERDILLGLLSSLVANKVEIRFNQTLTAIEDSKEQVDVTFKDASKESYDLVLGCDGIHSAVRRIHFGDESNFSHFLNQYFSITIVDKTFIRPNTSQMYNEPGKAVMLHGYENKTDIVLCFYSDDEIPYDYRNELQQRKIIYDQFEDSAWRSKELLDEVKKSKTFYFDKLCQIKMPSWTKGRVALVGDAGYCASPAAGMGGSLAIIGAAALADAFAKHPDDYALAFATYNKELRPFVEEVQANAVAFGLDMLVPRTQDAIDQRNLQLQEQSD